jgi:diaminohydroxyphosphoribosylaminopyrimidine deaminase/5-amino-6-(5-phosphoribosylamino)uracil reductase
MKIQSVIVEGGAKLLQSFIDEDMWDEARVIKNENLIIHQGLAAPELPVRGAKQELRIVSDCIDTYFKEANTFRVK